jgi:DUF4097 and DUF4098 domain-containing protein YvlB
MGAGLIAVLMGVLLAQDTQMTREGAFWVLTESGTATGAQIVKISTRGSVVIRGSQADQIQYKLTKRVRAREKDDAHRMMGSTAISISIRDRKATLVVAPAIRSNVITQLEVSMPRGTTTLLVDTQAGDVEAYDLDCNVHADTTVGQIHCDRIRGWAEGNTGGGEIHMGKIGGTVRCVSAAGSIFVDSSGGEAICQTAGGEIQVHEAAGPMTLSTEGGNIQVDRAGSTVEAHTGQGVIEISQAAGMVLADTRGGSIQVGSARGVKCQSGAGTIRVKTLSGPLNVQTAMGSILAELLAGARIEDASLIAGSGDITVLIPSNLALSLVARNETGGNPRIVSDFSELRPKAFPKAFSMPRPQLVYEGSINGGGPLITINTGSGTIYVRKLK